MSWSWILAGTLRAQLGHFGVESVILNLAETRVRSVPGEGLEPSRRKPSQDFKSCASVSSLRSSLGRITPLSESGMKDPTGGPLDGKPTLRPSELGTQGCENQIGLHPRLEQGAEGRSEPHGQNARRVICGSVYAFCFERHVQRNLLTVS